MPKRKLYFTCALSGLSKEHREGMMALRDSLSDRFEILEFCDPKQVTEQEMYRYDIHHCVAEADLMLAMVGKRAIGLGYEMGTMIEKHGRPVLALAHSRALVSPFVRGIDHPKFEFKRYQRLVSVKPLLIEFEERIFS